MPKVNRFGLSRAIPTAIKKKIRKDSRFGCVVCGSIPYEYEHIDPEFSLASKHDPDRMALLCPNHNQEKRKGLLTADDVFYHKKHPSGLSSKFSRHGCRSRNRQFGWRLPGVTFKDTRAGIIIEGEEFLIMSNGSCPEEPLRIRGRFFDANGREHCRVYNNEIEVIYQNVGDFTCEANRFKFTSEDGGKTYLEFMFLPQEEIIDVVELDMLYRGCRVWSEPEALFVDNGAQTAKFERFSCDGIGAAVETSFCPLPPGMPKQFVRMVDCSVAGLGIGVKLG